MTVVGIKNGIGIIFIPNTACNLLSLYEWYPGFQCYQNSGIKNVLPLKGAKITCRFRQFDWLVSPSLPTLNPNLSSKTNSDQIRANSKISHIK